MSDDGWSGRRGPGGPSYSDSDHPSSSSRTVPIYVLFLIMLGSGIFTLIFLWICVQYIYHRRRVRRARADVERNAAAEQQSGWEFAHGGAAAPGAKEVACDAKRCDAGVELTYVVMAGEDEPTFLARPLSTSQDPPSPSPSPSAGNTGDGAPVAVSFEKASALGN